MASPDFRQYVDLTINDVQPADIYDEAVAYAKTVLPDFSPKTGTVEDAVLQAISYVSGLMTGAINRLPNGLMEGVLNLYGFTRSQSSFATGSVIFTAIDSTGVTIPAGTRIAYVETTGGETIQHVFSTDSEVTISSGSTTSSAVPVTAVSSGTKPAIDDGDSMVLLTASNRILSVAFSGTLSQGTSGETDAEYFARGATYLSSLSEALVTSTQVTNYLLTTYIEAKRAKTLDITGIYKFDGVQIFESSGELGASVTGAAPGDAFPTPLAGDLIRIVGASDTKFNKVYELTSIDSTTFYVTDTSGASSGEVFTGDYTVEVLMNMQDPSLGGFFGGPQERPGFALTVVSKNDGTGVSEATKTSAISDIGDRLVAGLSYDVVNALTVDVNVEINISVLTGFDEIAVRDNVEAVIGAYLSTQNWNWDQKIRANNILARAATVAGVDYVDSVTMTLDAGELLATVDGGTGDVDFGYRGTLPVATVSCGAI